MPLSNAEKQRRYRQKRDADPIRRAEHKAKCKTKYQEDLAVGKRKLIKDMSPREQRAERKSWKKRKTSQRKRKRNDEEILTPPSSPVRDSPDIQPMAMGHQNTRRKKRNIAKCYRDNAKLRQQLEAQKRRNNKLLVRIHRQKLKEKTPDSPRTKTNKLLRNWSTEKGTHTKKERRDKKKRAKKALVFQLALSEELKEKYKRSKQKEKNYLSELTRGKLMKRYKLIDKTREELRMKAGTKRFKKGTLSYRLEPQVFAFYERDDNSKITAGMKDTVTKQGVKKQRRILTDTIERIHERFLIENSDIDVSYTTFCRLRPFWVQPPKEADRVTCACKQHENMQFLADAMYNIDRIKSRSLSTLVKNFSCDISNLDCMYGRCTKCRDVIIPDFGHNKDDEENNRDTTVNNDDDETSWFQWGSIRPKRLIKGKEKEVTITVKERVNGSIKELKTKFSEDMKRFKIHSFNITNQIGYYRKLKEFLKENEALIHVDFAENFQCKLASEIQDVHFGASKKQITLHTGVYYIKSGPETFCGVSDSLDHNPSSVWAFLDPVLDKLLLENPSIDTMYFFSDGPATQYKQKGNFFLLTHEMSKRDLSGYWNFHEHGHGKGVPDGVGGALKRRANDVVLHGQDITNAKSFVEKCKADSAVFIYEVAQQEIDNKSLVLSKETLKPIVGTQKIHQIKYAGFGEVMYRDISCSCRDDTLHQGHQLKSHSLIEKRTEKQRNKACDKSTVETELHKNESKKVNMTPTTIDISEDKTIARNYFFSRMLKELGQCITFEQIQNKCTEIYRAIEEKGYDLDDTYSACIINTGLEIDADALLICPTDIPCNTAALNPIKVTADGNCLPYSGSIIATGKEESGEEIRVRIIVELALYKHLYLNQQFLEKGTEHRNRDIAKTYALYSDEYANEALSPYQIERIFEKEVIKITKNKSYIGIWQLCALSGVLGRQICSIYPKLGNPEVRKDLHRLIEPRELRNTERGYILWTSTRQVMNRGNWIPNHFVALLPMNPVSNPEAHKDKAYNSEVRKDNDSSSEECTDKDSCRHESIDNDSGKSVDDVSGRRPEDLKGLYVLVNYDNHPYPGIVLDCDKTELFVRCMRNAEKDLSNNSFYWPLAVKDQLWYGMSEIICLIPEPKSVGTKYHVDNELWKRALQKLNK